MTFIEKIENILPEIDINTGLMYCGDDEELFEEAMDIEQSVKKGEIDFAKEHHEAFMSHYKNVLEGLKRCIE